MSTSTVIRPVEDTIPVEDTAAGVFGRSRHLSDRPHEQVVFCEDAATGRVMRVSSPYALNPAGTARRGR